MSVTREVILKIKMDMARSYGAGSMKTVTDQAKRAGDAVEDSAKRGSKGLGEMSRGLRVLMSDLDKVEQKAKKTGDSFKFGSGRGGAGSGGSSGQGLASNVLLGNGNLLGRLGLSGLAVGGALTAGREAGSLLANSWGAGLHGGPMMKGSSPVYEWFDSLVRGTEYRTRKEDWNTEDYGMLLRQREGRFTAQQQGIQSRYELQQRNLSPFATSAERLELLRSQVTPVAGFNDRAARIRGEADALAARQDQNAANYRRYLGEGKVPGLFNSNTTTADSTGFKKTKFDQLEAERTQTLQDQLTTNLRLVGALKEQATIHQQIKSNLEAQRDTVKSMVTSRRESLVNFGMMGPYQQKAALGVAQALKEGRALTPEQKAIGAQVPEIADYLQRRAGSDALQNPDYQEIIRLVGRTGDAGRFQQSLQGMPKLQPGELALDVFVRVDEDTLGRVIADKLRDVVKEIEINQTEQANRMAEGERLRLRQQRDRGAALGNAAPGQAP